jgi:hypothetical protein
MNILDFEKWSIINEGFKADINADKDNDQTIKTDEIQIEAPNEGNDITYVITGNDVKIKEQTKTKDEEGKISDTDVVEKNVDDKMLKKDVKIAVDAINDIKERERAKEIYRLTGGDDTTLKDTIIGILDDPNSKLKRERESDGTETTKYSLKSDIEQKCQNFWGENGVGEYVYLDLTQINKSYDVNIKDMYDITSVKTVGKGEYLLPLLYLDVYKQQVYGQEKYDIEQFSIGDNFILINDNEPINNSNKYHLELKAPNAILTFKKDNISENDQYIKYIQGNEEIEDRYKCAIASSFMQYRARQNKNRANLYMCIFNVENDTPKGILFINISNIGNAEITSDSKKAEVNKLFNAFKELIHIDTADTSSKKDFKYTVTMDGDKPQIKCNLHKSYLSDDINSNIQKIRHDRRIEKKMQKEQEDAKNESKILSRDNFVNEIYTK